MPTGSHGLIAHTDTALDLIGERIDIAVEVETDRDFRYRELLAAYHVKVWPRGRRSSPEWWSVVLEFPYQDHLEDCDLEHLSRLSESQMRIAMHKSAADKIVQVLIQTLDGCDLYSVFGGA